MRRALGAVFTLLLATAPGFTAQDPERVIDVRATRPAASNSFEALWGAYRKADAGGDAENARKILDEIRRFRIERNVRSLEEIGLALVARGLDALQKGDRARAEEEFRQAIGLDPYLPDAYFGLALTDLKKGPLGVLPAVRSTLAGVTARLDTARGEYYLLSLVVAVGLLGLLATTLIVALSMLLRYGTLLLHDFEETFGAGRGRAFALAVHGVLMFLPALTFQGWAWLPLWWLALLFLYASRGEKVVVLATLVAAAASGPAIAVLEGRVLAARNPLFRAATLAMEGGPDRRAIADLDAAVRSTADDVDLAYLLAVQYKKAAQYEDAAAVYRDILRKNEKDAIALNNLANLEFARTEFPAAITRYKLAAQAGEGGSSKVLATVYYNLNLAYLQKFERQPADEARAQADRLGGGLTREYDNLWKYEARNENAVVDLGLSREQVWAKFAGVAEGVGTKNVAGRSVGATDLGSLARAAANRLSAFLLVFVAVYVGLARWRGRRMFTMRCQKCGTPFCKRCHLGAAPTGLCTQCFHLFVVRDGVSGPARNQKLLEVQKEDERRERIFRALSLLSPGAGHLYAHKAVAGVLFSLAWYLLLSLTLLAGRIFPVTEAPAVLSGRWPLVMAGILLLVTYVLANRARPDFEVALPLPRGPRRGRTA
ncbi:MAG: hypothetical protein HY317_03290 [Acidobacteria bacterium]|nr:hypothetical protein [Acidobacteriota bacterium]